MADLLQVTILGCGSSPGVPRIGNDWGACDPLNPRNVRSRCSIHVRRIASDGLTTDVLVDTSPDLRQQALAARLHRLDGVLFTHAHADHVHGIDDLRGFVINMQRRVDVHADEPTMARIREGFGYCFATPPGSDYPPILNAHLFEPDKEFGIEGPGGPLHVLPILQQHGRARSLAFRFGSVAYSPDVSALSDAAAERLLGLDLWIVDALRYKPHPSHFSVSETLSWIERLRPKRAILTHMHIDLDYEALRRTLPEGVEPAYDRMVVEMPYL